jgi:hypothetical protein
MQVQCQEIIANLKEINKSGNCICRNRKASGNELSNSRKRGQRRNSQISGTEQEPVGLES